MSDGMVFGNGTILVDGETFDAIVDWLDKPSEPSAKLRAVLEGESKWDYG